MREQRAKSKDDVRPRNGLKVFRSYQSNMSLGSYDHKTAKTVANNNDARPRFVPKPLCHFVPIILIETYINSLIERTNRPQAKLPPRKKIGASHVGSSESF